MKQEFFTIGAFEFPADVQIIKLKLESEGIPVFLKDENTINTDPLISQAIGGVKLQVYSKDREKAMNIYNSIRRYAQDNNGQLISCQIARHKDRKFYYARKGLFFKLFHF